MKLIFLDIDGVLNSETFFRQWIGKFSHPCNDHLDDEAIERLNDLIKATDAKVVLSSTWRKIYKIESLDALLQKHGFKYELYAKTPSLNTIRGLEIKDYMRQHHEAGGEAVTGYVILDDDSDMTYGQREHFIHTDPFCGLTPRNVRHAIKILQKPWKYGL